MAVDPKAPRIKVPLPLAIGRGLSRDVGLAAVSPATPVDVRNVYARNGKMAVRPGLAGTGFPVLIWGTDELAIVPIEATGDVLHVIYDRVSGDVRVYLLNIATGTIQTLTSPVAGYWGTLNALAEFPIITAAESAGQIFLAHDEGNLAYRFPTIVYTPNFAVPTLPGTMAVLSQDLNGSGTPQPVYFRGVYQYLYYVFGWGYGSVADPDRGDILRYCNATDPTTWRPENNFNVGVKKVPIISCVVAFGLQQANASTQQTILAVCKEDGMYQIIGTDPDTFGVLALDDKYGAVSARCTVNVGGRAFTWSSDGAREIVAGGTVLWAQPLELDSPLPADFPTLGPARDCFVAYDQPRKRVIWAFPDLVNASSPVAGFCLSLWDPKDPRWTFEVIEQPVSCAGGRTFSDPGGAPPPAPHGYASAVSANDVGQSVNTDDRNLQLAFTNNLASGNEIVHLWAKPAGGAWVDVAQFPLVGDSQTYTWAGALPLTAYSLALAYYNGPTPGVGYSGTPDTWTAPTAGGSQTAATTSCEAVSWVSGAFGGPTLPVSLVWTNAQTNVPYLLEKSTNGGGTWTTLATGLVATTFSYPVPPAEIGTTVRFRVTPKNGTVAGASASLDVPMVITVGQAVITSCTFSATTAIVTTNWNALPTALQYLLEKSTNAGASWTPVATVSATTYAYEILPAEANTTLEFRVTGKNGSVSGAPSVPASVTCTITIGPPAMTGLAVSGFCGTLANPFQELEATLTPASGTTIGQQVEWSANGTVVQTDTIGPADTFDFLCDGYHGNLGILWSVRARGFSAGPVYGPYSAPVTLVV